MTGLADLAKLVLWYVALGLAACGAAWCGSYGSVTEAMQGLRPQVARERELRRDVARGLAEIETFLGAQPPRSTRHRPRRATGGDVG